jgi:hypothetical protein
VVADEVAADADEVAIDADEVAAEDADGVEEVAAAVKKRANNQYKKYKIKYFTKLPPRCGSLFLPYFIFICSLNSMFVKYKRK